MKIFLIKVPELLQPASQKLVYPPHNKDYGMEQDFLIWLHKNPQLLTDNPVQADWHYLPVYWTRWHINHNFAENGEGIEQLQKAVDKVIIDGDKTFTVAQFDGGSGINLGNTLEFISSRTDNTGIDIPVLCEPHMRSIVPVRKKYLASFNGAFTTDPIRIEMKNRLGATDGVLIGGTLPTPFYIRWTVGKQYNINTQASYIALAPRGSNCSSYRFFEAMQFGVPPCLIGDRDVRPFKKFIDWNSMSYYVQTVSELEGLLNSFDKKDALEKGKVARHYWKHELGYQKWCKYLMMELGDIRFSK